ncbi:MAG: type II toxin-antitoxin system RelE/ParE family toxin [bacterium]
MGNWSFKAFVNKSGHGFQVWYDELPIKAKAKFDRRLVYLQIQSIEAWKPPLVRKLKGYNKIFEHRVDFNKELFRPLGFFGSKGQEFIFLIGAKEQGDILIPRDAPEIAKSRMELVIRDRSYINDLIY